MSNMYPISHILYVGNPESPKVFSLQETNHFVDEFNFEYSDPTKTNFVVEVWTPDDLSSDKVYKWGGLEPTYFATYEKALACFAQELNDYATISEED